MKTNESVNLPNDLAGLAFPRSSLLRMGCFVHVGVGDAGFHGKLEFIFVVGNPKGVSLKQNARVAQLIFTEIEETKRGYDGVYNGLE